MYELYLTATVSDAELDATCEILSGLCGMKPWNSLTRQLFFQGSVPPTGFSNMRSIEKPMRKEVGLMWKELHQSLSRQPFILQARYDVQQDRDMGSDATPITLDERQGILRWSDIPDPSHGRPQVTQSKVVELWEQKNIVSVLTDNNFHFKSEILVESKRFYRDDLEYSLKRSYHLSPMHEYSPVNPQQGSRTPSATVPSWENMTTIDPEKRWVLNVTLHVLQDNKPDDFKKAQERLIGVQKELDRVFEFKTLDRRVFDTRIPQRPQGVQALGNKITVGK